MPALSGERGKEMLERLNQMVDELWKEEDTLRDRYIDMYYALGMDPREIHEPKDVKDIQYKKLIIWTAIEEIEKIEKGGN